MPRLPSRLAAVLCLVLVAAACAPAKKTAPPVVAKADGKSAAPAPAKAAPPAPARNKPLSVVMGAPLPAAVPGADKAPTPYAPSGAATTPPPVAPATATAAGPSVPAGATPAASQPAPAGLGDGAGQTPGAAPTGFGGLAWGVSAKSNPGLATYEVDPAASVTTCLWPQGPNEVGGAPIREAFYEFFQDRFYHVWLEFDGMAAYKTALAGLTRTYGPPTQENPEKYYHAWTLGEVNIYCAFHPGENGGDVSFFYQPLYEKMMAAKKAGPAKHAAGKAKS